jgi:1,4-dihydroxy-2-naphthoate polyprenyltransferase
VANKTNKKRPPAKRTSGSKSASKPSGKNRAGRPGGQQPRAVVHKASASDWIGAARLRTLPVALAPVALGTAAAFVYAPGEAHWVRALLCLAVALCLQIGVNYANDYSDGIRGTDAHRIGPARLTASGAAKPRAVLTVALGFFVLAAVAGVAVVVLSGHYWLLVIGAACVAAAWFYTGGKHPYGYYGLGEVFVFVFFGLIATAGTTYVQVGAVNIESWLAGAAAGFLACAVLMVNNLRDLEQDALARKRTLAVLLGAKISRILFGAFVAIPFLILIFFAIFYLNAPLVYFALLLAVPAVLIVSTGKTAPEFMLALRLTSLTVLVFGLGLAAAIAF